MEFLFVALALAYSLAAHAAMPAAPLPLADLLKKPVAHPKCDTYPEACSDNCCGGCMSSTGSYDGSYELVCTP